MGRSPCVLTQAQGAASTAVRSRNEDGGQFPQQVATRRTVTDPSSTTQDEVDRLRAAGLSDADVLSATVFVAMRLAFSTVNAALGAAPDQQLLDDAPPEVAQVVSYGRPVVRQD